MDGGYGMPSYKWEWSILDDIVPSSSPWNNQDSSHTGNPPTREIGLFAGALDGEPLSEEEMKEKRDFGPIGSGIPKSPQPSSSRADEKLVYSWVSDYIGKADVYGSGGLIPHLPRTAEMKEVVPLLYPNAPVNNQCSRYAGIFEKKARDEYKMMTVQQPKLLGSGTDNNAPFLDSPTDEPFPPVSPLLLSPAESSTSSSSSRGNSSSTLSSSPVPRSITEADMMEFVKTHGYMGKRRAGFCFKPRKGKYFKEF